MSSYPRVNALPLIVESSSWEWKPFEDPARSAENFFEATDEFGNRWLTKMRGSFYAYRELVFERLVQRSGWLCQSSCFTVLDNTCLPMQKENAESVQLVTRLLEEHEQEGCGPDCPMRPLRGECSGMIEKLSNSYLKDGLNIARKDILAYLLGGNEPADVLTTVGHEVYLIDGEQMFSTSPSDVRNSCWWEMGGGEELIRDICRKIGQFSDRELDSMLEKPSGISINETWDIRSKLYEARNYARDFEL
ncbi:MAG: hypothetical protein L3J30_10780 [Marinosulfonomonas sp.]|nr:hypothetical protein [Marinosulfonomonas sp.]